MQGRWFFIEIGGLDDHPRRDLSVHKRLGPVRGLLIHDADTRMSRIEYPDDSELWTSPRPVIEGGELRIYASSDEVERGAPARAIPLEKAFVVDGSMEWMITRHRGCHSCLEKAFRVHSASIFLGPVNVDEVRSMQVHEEEYSHARRKEHVCVHQNNARRFTASHLTWPFGHAVQSPLAADRNAVQLTAVKAQPVRLASAIASKPFA